MRPVIRLVIAEIDAVPFMVANYYDQAGQHADVILKPAVSNFAVRQSIAELMRVHEVQTADLYTDNDDVYKTFLPAAGINVHYESKAALRDVYANLAADSPIFPAIRELFFAPEADKPAADPAPQNEAITERPSKWRRLIQFMKECFARD
ncbi:hypothetical protein [Cohnella lupini]|uniref:Uncharacterized protein n=1 Tax=Cohnella lupini TaxID=1294267 RepID=A0A3D9I5X4_9BACL|nr:hypothetical protein [Cohnella lupini]RED57173.1 hypothetical protein DFP95_11187 [Cohnella lupini]